MKDNGFEAVSPMNIKRKYSSVFRKDNFNEDTIGEFHRLIEKIPEMNKTDDDFKHRYQDANRLKMNVLDRKTGKFKDLDKYTNNPVQQLSSFNNYFIFQKVIT
tara:strand:- start:1112 stop:1420 length:309 start_codon:yes stop_codon:yes gene_type:complete